MDRFQLVFEDSSRFKSKCDGHCNRNAMGRLCISLKIQIVYAPQRMGNFNRNAMEQFHFFLNIQIVSTPNASQTSIGMQWSDCRYFL